MSGKRESSRPYREDKSGFIVRDLLAFDRTLLANERTLLAYVRTFIGVLGSGAALLKIFEMPWAHTVGTLLLVLAPLILLFGILRFLRTNRRIRAYQPDPPKK